MVYADFQELKTPRLVLRRLRLEDATDFFCFGGSEAVTRYMLWRPHKSVEESEASIRKALCRYADGKYYRWGISLRETDKLIGMIDLLGFSEEENCCTFAYMLSAEFWGKGYGTESLKAVLAFAFEKLELSRVEADHFASNAASGAVMRKAGMSYVCTQLGKYEKDGILYDAPWYRITRKEWEKSNS